MKNNKSINELFQITRLRAEVMALDDVHSLIANDRSARGNRFFNFKNGLIMITFIIALSALLFQTRDQEKLNNKKSENTTSIKKEFLLDTTMRNETTLITQDSELEIKLKPKSSIKVEPISPKPANFINIQDKKSYILRKIEHIKSPEIEFNWNVERVGFKISRATSRIELKQIQEEIDQKSNGEIEFKFGFLFKNSDGLTDLKLTLDRKNSKNQNSCHQEFFIKMSSQEDLEFGWEESDSGFLHFFHTFRYGDNEIVDFTCSLSEETISFLDEPKANTAIEVQPGEYSVTLSPNASQAEIDLKLLEAEKNGIILKMKSYDKKSNKKTGLVLESESVLGMGWRLIDPKDSVTVKWQITDELLVRGICLLLEDEAKPVYFDRLNYGGMMSRYKCNCQE